MKSMVSGKLYRTTSKMPYNKLQLHNKTLIYWSLEKHLILFSSNHCFSRQREKNMDLNCTCNNFNLQLSQTGPC